MLRPFHANEEEDMHDHGIHYTCPECLEIDPYDEEVERELMHNMEERDGDSD